MRDERTQELIEIPLHDMRRWEGPYVYVAYPKQLFKASTGKYQDADQEKTIAKTQADHERLSSDWQESPDLARAHYDRQQNEIAKASAESAGADRSMSAKAQIERAKYDGASDFDMVTDVPAPKLPPRAKKD